MVLMALPYVLFAKDGSHFEFLSDGKELQKNSNNK